MYVRRGRGIKGSKVDKREGKGEGREGLSVEGAPVVRHDGVDEGDGDADEEAVRVRARGRESVESGRGRARKRTRRTSLGRSSTASCQTSCDERRSCRRCRRDCLSRRRCRPARLSSVSVFLLVAEGGEVKREASAP